MTNIPPLNYIFSIARGNSHFYSVVKNCFIIGYFWGQYKREKYYKGTESILYFPYVSHNDLKVCPKVKIPYYYGLKCDKIIFDEFPSPDWTKECDPSLSGKLSGITVKNW